MNAISDILSEKDFGATIPQKHSSPSTANEYEYSRQTTSENKPFTPQTPQNTTDTSVLIKTLEHMQDQINGMLRILQDEHTLTRRSIDIATHTNLTEVAYLPTGETIIEGVFDGHQMVGPDGKTYAVPPNYASKSKLVEGDLMKLTITTSGAFLYKQIGPVVRARLTGELVNLGGGKWGVQVGGRTYNILTASVTFHKGTSGDEVVILVPEDGESGWGAVDNIMTSRG